MSYRAALLNSALWETDGGSADELLPNALTIDVEWQPLRSQGQIQQSSGDWGGGGGGLEMMCDVANEFTAAKSLCTNDSAASLTVETW